MWHYEAMRSPRSMISAARVVRTLCAVCCCLFATSGASRRFREQKTAAPPPPPRAVRELASRYGLGENDLGQLSFVQSEAKKQMAGSHTGGHKELFAVEVNIDIEEMDAPGGLTMVFDKLEHVLRLDKGISSVDGIAWGRYDDKIATTGWSELWVEITARPGVSNDVRMYSAGFIEGMLTCVRMSEHYSNTLRLVLRREAQAHALASIKKVFKNEIAFMMVKANIEKHILASEPEDLYWKHMRYILFQLWGLCDGYNFVAHHFGVQTLTLEDMLLLNSGGDLAQLMEAYTPFNIAQRLAANTPLAFMQEKQEQQEHHQQMTASNMTAEDPLDDAHWEKKVATTGRCSAFIRVADGNSDLLVGHTTWDDYSRMMRVFKYYKFPLHACENMASQIAMSSYPGAVSSTDDFYIMDSGLTVMDTSIEVMDVSVYEHLPEFPLKPTVPVFVHVMITNRLAKSAAHWSRLYLDRSPGLYAAQWMVVDYNKFVPGKVIQDNLLWVIEEIPGMSHSEDLSHFLRRKSYWPSFNRPYFDEIRGATGHTGAQQSHGDMYSWANNPRARVFAGAAASTNALFDMRGLMTRNLYPNSGIIPAEPGHDISARMDLSMTQPIPNGGIDAKVTNRCLFKTMQVQAKSGPSSAMLPAFHWKSAAGAELWPGWPHMGLPDVDNFGFVQMGAASAGGIMDIASC